MQETKFPHTLAAIEFAKAQSVTLDVTQLIIAETQQSNIDSIIGTVTAQFESLSNSAQTSKDRIEALEERVKNLESAWARQPLTQ